MGAIYGSDYIWESSDGVKSLLNVGLLVMSVRELNVNWGQRNENTAGIILLSVGCKMPHVSNLSLKCPGGQKSQGGQELDVHWGGFGALSLSL